MDWPHTMCRQLPGLDQKVEQRGVDLNIDDTDPSSSALLPHPLHLRPRPALEAKDKV
jgi:hypothetical protein